jgi:hypothetical protein
LRSLKSKKGGIKMKTKRTKKGWTMEITNMENDCLEQGGVLGRVIFWTNETLKKLGIDPCAQTGEDDWNDTLTIGEYLLQAVTPDKVLTKGVEIE